MVVYTLKPVVHDWTGEILEAVLGRYLDAAIDGWRILVIETLLPAGNTLHPDQGQ